MALIRYNGKNVLYHDMKRRIMPGVNEVTEGVLDALLKHPLFKNRFDKGVLEIVEREEKAKKDKDGKRPQDEMLKLIPEIFDLKLLEKIIKTDGRNRVVGAAKDQLEKLSIKAEDSEKAKLKAKDKNEHFKSDNS